MSGLHSAGDFHSINLLVNIHLTLHLAEKDFSGCKSIISPISVVVQVGLQVYVHVCSSDSVLATMLCISLKRYNILLLCTEL